MRMRVRVSGLAMNQEFYSGISWHGTFGRWFDLIFDCTCPRKFIFALPALLLLNSGAIAQQQSPTTLHVETQLVQIRVRVVDRHGNPIPGLAKSDFAIKENGHPQQVSILNYIPAVTPVSRTAQAPRPLRPAVVKAAPQFLSVPRVWIFIDTEVDSTEIPQAYQAIRNFLTNQFKPGFMVSLDGLPFTSNQPQLLATLDKMRQHPHGRGSDVPPLVASTMFMEKQADYQWLQYSALVYGRERIAPPPGFARLTMRPTAQANSAREQLGTTEREMAFYVRAPLFRYLDIIHALEILHGQKMVVIFRSGLRMGPDNTGLLHTFAAEAMRHRIAFYTVDSRGLLTIDPSSNKEKAQQYGLRPQSLTMDFTRALNNYNRTKELVMGRVDGLVDVARLTGGKAVTNTNDLGMVFDDVVQDSSGCYTVGYYSTDQREGGGFRRLKVAVDRANATVIAPKGYYEPLPFKKLSKREKMVVLWRALNYEMPRALPVSTSVSVFRGDDDQPVAVVSAGVRIGGLTAQRKGRLSELHTAALAEIKATGAELPIYRGEYATVPIPRASLRRAQSDPTVFLTYDWTLPVSPGRHICKVVFRDENTGELGADQVQFDAPEYGAAPATSSLLVTREASRLQPDPARGRTQAQPANSSGLLEAANLNFAPEPDSDFLQGDNVYLLCDLYNPPSLDANAVVDFTRSLGLQILRNGAPLKSINVDWKISPDTRQKIIRVVGMFNTSSLPPGSYQMVETIPMGTGQTPKRLPGAFKLLPVPDLHGSRSN
jgi:VWFA-related protein